MTMKIIDRKNIEILRTDLQAAIDAVGKKHGISIKLGTGRYSNGPTGKFNAIEIATISEGGEVISREAQSFTINAGLYGLKPSDLHRTFKPIGDKSYKITGLSTKSYKHPILAMEVGTTKTFKFSAETVKHWLSREQASV